MPSAKYFHFMLFPQADYKCKSKVKSTLIQNPMGQEGHCWGPGN